MSKLRLMLSVNDDNFKIANIIKSRLISYLKQKLQRNINSNIFQ